MIEMCGASKCEHPEKLKGNPNECTSEQIAKCHPELKGHPCTEK